jgi:hypothetical protein
MNMKTLLKFKPTMKEKRLTARLCPLPYCKGTYLLRYVCTIIMLIHIKFNRIRKL